MKRCYIMSKNRSMDKYTLQAIIFGTTVLSAAIAHSAAWLWLLLFLLLT